jgi:DNA-binding MarR family transcriptional regulator
MKTKTDPTARLLGAILKVSRGLRAVPHAGALAPAKLLALGALSRDAGITGRALAARLRVRPQSLTRLLAELEAAELIARDGDADDRRKTRIRITGAGEAALAAELGMRQRRLAAVLGMTDLAEAARVAAFLERLAAAMTDDDDADV